MLTDVSTITTGESDRKYLTFIRKTKFLAGSNIYITEDFSKKVKDKRTELQKFMRKMRKRLGWWWMEQS